MAAESSCKGHGHGEDKESQPLLQSSQDDGHSRGSPLISGQHPVGQLWREAEASLCRPRRSPSLPPSLPHELCPQPLGSALGLSRASSDKTIRGRNIYGKVVKMQISAVAPRVTELKVTSNSRHASTLQSQPPTLPSSSLFAKPSSHLYSVLNSPHSLLNGFVLKEKLHYCC